MPRCPGQDQRFWKPDDIFDVPCPQCGAVIEFWKDEPHLKCPKCRTRVVNPKLDLGCAEWCQYADQCLGTAEDKEDILCKRLVREVKALFGPDRQRLDRTLRVLGHAQQILAAEGGDARLVNATAILHDVEQASAAQTILRKCGLDAETTKRVADAIDAWRSDNGEGSLESRILADAVNLANLDGNAAGESGRLQPQSIERTFKTQKARELAAGALTDLPHNQIE